jgi:dihydrofolate reductase
VSRVNKGYNNSYGGYNDMRKIIANTFITLDGVMQAPGGPEEDPTSGFDYGGWSVNYWDEMMAKVLMDGLMAKPFDLMLGRKTYEIFAAHWPFVKNDPDKMNAMAADKLNGAKKYVVSKTLSKASWENSTLIKGDIVKEISNLKRQEGPEIQIHGSSDLIQTLLSHDLIDEFCVWTFPLTVGRGKRLFGRGSIPAGLKLLDCKVSKTGVIIATYSRDGKIKTGSLALEIPTKEELERRKRLKLEK